MRDLAHIIESIRPKEILGHERRIDSWSNRSLEFQARGWLAEGQGGGKSKETVPLSTEFFCVAARLSLTPRFSGVNVRLYEVLEPLQRFPGCSDARPGQKPLKRLGYQKYAHPPR